MIWGMETGDKVLKVLGSMFCLPTEAIPAHKLFFGRQALAQAGLLMVSLNCTKNGRLKMYHFQ